MAHTISLNDTSAQPARSPMFWLLLGAVAAAQLVAFWLLCSHQVRKAEARETQYMVQQLALADCLQYVPGSTIASCSRGAAPMQASAQAAQQPAVAGAMAVNVIYR